MRSYMTLESVPVTWRGLLARVQEVCPGAVMSGGCLRDLDMNIKAKDIDIFLPADCDFKGVKEALGAVEDDWAESKEYTFGRSLVMQTVQINIDTYVAWAQQTGPNTMTLVDEPTPKPVNFHGKLPELNLIKLKEGLDPMQRWREHDFGACQIAFDGRQIHATPAYMQDTDRQQFTLDVCLDAASFHRSIKRYNRWRDRYPTWPLVLKPEHVEFMYDVTD